jgi:hypothetical protein
MWSKLFIYLCIMFILCFMFNYVKNAKKICNVIYFVYYCLNIKNAKIYIVWFILFKSKGMDEFSLTSRYAYIFSRPLFYFFGLKIKIIVLFK